MTGATVGLEDQIASLIRDSIGVEVPGPSTDLIDGGFLDSLAVVTLITEIEVVFSHPLPLETLDLESFRSVERIAAYLTTTGLPESEAG